MSSTSGSHDGTGWTRPRWWGIALVVGLVAAALWLGSPAAATDAEEPVLVDDFTHEYDEEDWEEVVPPDANDDCGSVSSPTSLKFGGAPNGRYAITVPLDATKAETIAFHIKFGSGPYFPCKDDGADRDVRLQYSTEGDDWTNMSFYDDDTYKTWTYHVETIPEEASTNSTQFRWIQEGPNHIGRQQWAMDDVWIHTNLTEPAAITAEPTQAWGTIELTWEEPEVTGTEPLQGYHVYRGKSPGDVERVATVGPDERTFVDEDLDPGRPYAYQVAAFNADREGPLSDTVEAETAGPTIIRDGFEADTIDAFAWPTVLSGRHAAGCGSASGDQALHFDGWGTRRATTLPLNVTEGGLAAFELRIGGPQSTATESRCEDADPGEDVHLSYETGDGEWSRLASFDADAYHGFRQVVEPLPDEALTNQTRLRISQPSSSSNADQWAIDDAVIGSLPSAPRNVTAEPADEGTRVSWDEPRTDGGFAIDAYNVYREGPDGERELAATAGPQATEVHVDATPLGQTEAYTVVAENRAGEGVASEPDHVEGTQAPNLQVASGDEGTVAVYDDTDEDGEIDPGETWFRVEDGDAHVDAPRIGARLVSADVTTGGPLVDGVAFCTPAGLVCVGPVVVHAPALAVPGADAWLVADGEVGLTTSPGTEEIGPIETTVPVPGFGSLPVTVCASGCPVPANPASVDAGVTGDASLAGIQADETSLGD